MPTKTRINGENYTQLPRLVSDDIILKGLPNSAGIPTGYGDLANTVNALVDRVEKPFGRRWIFFGDSITNGSSAANFSFSYTRQAADAVGQMTCRLDYIEAGTGGDTSAQILARVESTLDLYPDVSAVSIMCGTNDAGAGVSASEFFSNLIGIIDIAKSRGLVVLVSTVIPRWSAASAGIHTLTNAYNLLIRLYQKQYGYFLVDSNAALIDTTTGFMLAAYDSGDGIHPNTLGHIKLGNAFAIGMLQASAVDNKQSLLQSVIPQGLITQDPLNARAAANSNGWYEWPGGTGTAPVYSMVSDTTNTLAAGRWAEMAVNAASGGTRRLATTGASGFSVGDTVAIFGRIQVEDLATRWESDNAAGTTTVGISVVNQSAVGITGASVFGGRSAGRKDSSGFYNLGYFFLQFVVPAGTTQLIPWISLTSATGSNLKLRIGEFAIVNITSLGLSIPDTNTPVTI